MKVQIQTTQNVEIEYETASLGERIGAFLIDLLILFAYVFLIMTTLLQPISRADGDTAFIILVALMLPALLYDLLCEIFMDGQSFGKKAVKIKVVKIDGTQPGLGSYILRWLLRFVEIWTATGVIAVVTILITGKGQRLGDLAAGTTVVRLKPTATLADTIFAQVDTDYLPTFPQVTRLNDRDIAVIKEVINSREQRQNPVVLNTLVRKVKEVLDVETDLTPAKFLKTVVKDYNHYAGAIDA
jgi:uncharacterized RDD family membrane protein YckC